MPINHNLSVIFSYLAVSSLPLLLRCAGCCCRGYHTVTLSESRGGGIKNGMKWKVNKYRRYDVNLFSWISFFSRLGNSYIHLAVQPALLILFLFPHQSYIRLCTIYADTFKCCVNCPYIMNQIGWYMRYDFPVLANTIQTKFQIK